MSSDRHTRIMEIFEEALELSPEERAQFLNEACRDDEALRAQVDELLALDTRAQAEGFLQSPLPASVIREISREGGESLVGRKLGHYQIQRIIDSGGMGTVYEAMQESPRRRVAVKVIHSSLTSGDAFRRFVYEAEILARLHHPGIGQVFEAGSFGDDIAIPYFAMEYIPGAQTITQYAEDQALSIRRRLELFAEICDAVHYGHQRGIIHRDLKPGNILVDDEGHPKVIDFGVARATDADITLATQLTDSGQLVGTLRYMSPEQYEGDSAEIDTRCDVYALGLVLYELLTGRLPYDFSRTTPFEIPRVVREQEPQRPSSFDRSLRGDIEVIVMQAIEKDRDRRYQSVDLLARDVRCHLKNEPIEARRGSRWYLIRKTLWRHRIAAAVAATFSVFLIGFGIAMSYMYFHAENEAETARKVQESLQEILLAADPYTGVKSDQPLRALLDDTARKIEVEIIPQPLVRGAVHYTLGTAYTNLGLFDKADKHLLAALKIRRVELGEDHPDVADTKAMLAFLRNATGDYGQAETLVREAIAVQRRGAGDTIDPLGGSLLILALILKKQGRYDAAEVAVREGLAIMRTLHGQMHPEIARALSHLSAIMQKKANYAESEALLIQALAIDRSFYGDEHAIVARDLNNLALVLRDEGRYKDAEMNHREALAIQRKVLGEAHPDVATSLDNLGCVLMLQSDLLSAKPLFHEALALRRKYLGESHPVMMTNWSNLAQCLQAEGDAAGAVEALRQALDVGRTALDENHPDFVETKAQLGDALRHTGRLDEAEKILREALSVLRSVLGESHVKVFNTMNDLALVLQDKGNLAEAETLLREALDRSRKLLGNEHPHVSTHLNNLGAVLRDLKKYEEAETLLLESLDSSRRISGGKSVENTFRMHNLGLLYLARGEYGEAEKMFQESLAIRRASMPETQKHVIGALYWYAYILAERGNHAKAVPLLREYVERLEVGEPDSPYLPVNRCFLGYCLLRLKSIDEAESLIIEGLEEMRKRFGDRHPYTQKGIRYAIFLYQSTDRAEEAAALKPLLNPGR